MVISEAFRFNYLIDQVAPMVAQVVLDIYGLQEFTNTGNTTPPPAPFRLPPFSWGNWQGSTIFSDPLINDPGICRTDSPLGPYEPGVLRTPPFPTLAQRGPMVFAAQRLDLGIDRQQYRYWRGSTELIDPGSWGRNENPATPGNFPFYFREAASNADGIDFHLDTIDQDWLVEMFRQGDKIRPGKYGTGYTAWELYTIFHSRDLLSKTTFYRNGSMLTSEEADQFVDDLLTAAKRANVPYRSP